jgi:hypothetical protein
MRTLVANYADFPWNLDGIGGSRRGIAYLARRSFAGRWEAEEWEELGRPHRRGAPRRVGIEVVGGIFREAVGNLLARGRGKKKKKRKARNGGKAKGCSGSYLNNSSTLENSIL